MAETVHHAHATVAHFNSWLAGTAVMSAIYLDGTLVKSAAPGNSQRVNYYSHSKTGIINQFGPTD